MLWKSDRPASMHCYTAATFSKTSHTVGRQHALTWRLTSIEKTAATSYCWIHWQGFPTFVRAFVCVYQSKQYTYLFVQTWVLSQQPHNALSILCPSLSSLSPPSSHSFSLTLCLPHTVSPSLSLSRSLALSLSLCGSTALSSVCFQHLLSHTLALLGEAELLSSLLTHSPPSQAPSACLLFVPFLLLSSSPSMLLSLSFSLSVCVVTYILPLFFNLFHFSSALALLPLCLFKIIFLLPLILCHCLCLVEVGQTWKQC